MKKTKEMQRIFLWIMILLIMVLFFIRLLSIKEIDDVSLEIPCEDENKYIEKAEILWVIPNFEGNKISENQEWCQDILSLNKTIGMHGITHSYREFKKEIISQEELEEGMKIFEDCFGFKPELFKSPQLKINKENKKLLKENNIKVKTWPHQFIRKVYHCNDSGILNNKIIDLI